MSVRTRLEKVAKKKGLRESTVLSYQRHLHRLDLLDRTCASVTPEEVTDALYAKIRNPNTRRAAVIAVRSVLGYDLRIPKGLPRRYDLPDEETLRRALAHSPHEVRGLVMAYAGLRIGEACAVTHLSVRKNRLMVDIQVQQLHRTGLPTETKIRPVKADSEVPEVVIPWWLAEQVQQVSETAKPDCVRESLRRAGQKEGIHINPHMLRHWYCTHLFNLGAPPDLTRRQMRHTDQRTTEGIYHQYNAEETIERLLGQAGSIGRAVEDGDQ